eukprot:3106633-Prymnesium_polylepis.1
MSQLLHERGDALGVAALLVGRIDKDERALLWPAHVLPFQRLVAVTHLDCRPRFCLAERSAKKLGLIGRLLAQDERVLLSAKLLCDQRRPEVDVARRRKQGDECGGGRRQRCRVRRVEQIGASSMLPQARGFGATQVVCTGPGVCFDVHERRTLSLHVLHQQQQD